MIKSNLVLPNGMVVHIETDNAKDMAEVFQNFGKTSAMKVAKNEGNNNTFHVKPKRHYKTRRGKGNNWTDRDLIQIGSIVKDNLASKGVSRLVKNYIRREADIKNRSMATIYTISSDIRGYLKSNDPQFIPKRTKRVLDNAGIVPVNR